MGFDPQMSNFEPAVVALCEKETWKRCHEAYRRWGWSDDDILSAFKLYPLYMTISAKNIMAKMDFFVNKMGWKSGKIAKYFYVFHYSLEKRIIPRCSVVRVLLSKGLIEENKLSLSWVSSTPEKLFLYTRNSDQVHLNCWMCTKEKQIYAILVGLIALDQEVGLLTDKMEATFSKRFLSDQLSLCINGICY